MSKFLGALSAALLLAILRQIDKRFNVSERVIVFIKRLKKKSNNWSPLLEEEERYFVDNYKLFEDDYKKFLKRFFNFCKRYEKDSYFSYLKLKDLLQDLERIDNSTLDVRLFNLFEEFRQKKNNRDNDIISKFLKKIARVFKKTDIITEIQFEYDQLEKEYKRLIIKIRKNMNPQYEYADLDNIKLNQDKNKYESYIGYWESSNRYIYNIINRKLLDLRRLKQNRHLNILDIGGGDGSVIYELIQDNDEVMFIEPDTKRIDEAKVRLKIKNSTIWYVNMRFEDIDWTTNTKKPFDVIICSHVIQHLSTNHYHRMVSEIKDLLQDTGFLFLMCPLSYSKYNEYVVHGLEYDQWRVNKQDVKDNMYRVLEKCSLDIPFDDLKPLPLKDGFMVYLNEEDTNVCFSLQEKQDCYLLYHRANEGLIASLPRHIDFCQIYEEVKKNIGFDIRECSKFTWFSRQWLIGDNQLAILDTVTDTVLFYTVEKNEIFEKHSYYSQQIEEKRKVPKDFCNVLKRTASKIVLNKLQENRWGLYVNEKEIAWIIRTQNHYFLINRQNPESYMMSYDSFKTNYTSYQFSDSEFNEGLIISENNSYGFFLRFDRDWLRLFKGKYLSKEEIEPIINGNVSIWKDNSVIIDVIKKDCIWNIKGEHNNAFVKLFPHYCVMHITDYDDSEKFFIYRDKRYTRICEEAFNKLCDEESSLLKILPTHHFVINELVDALRQNGLKRDSFFSYHLGAKLKFKDKRIHLGGILRPMTGCFFLRDWLFNSLRLNRFRYFRKIFEARDCMLVLKKKT